MREAKSTQKQFIFQAPDCAKITDEYFGRYERISQLLDRHPEIVEAVHEDLRKPLVTNRRKSPQGQTCRFASDVVLRMCVVKSMENLSFRKTVIRVDDSARLRAFTRIHHDTMMDYSTFCRLSNAISPDTWLAVNRLLAKVAVAEELIEGDKLRLDTTAVETNIHWPTDSGLLWDTYRTLARLVRQVRERQPDLVVGRRLHKKRAKRLHGTIGRAASRPSRKNKERQRETYARLISMVGHVLAWVPMLCERIERAATVTHDAVLLSIAGELDHYRGLGLRVVDQATRRVLLGESVPNEEKLFSIFEPHTELLKRGKAGKPVEFGHMVLIQQVPGCFITGYGVYEKRPSDHSLVDPALEEHERLFGAPPSVLAADKGFWKNAEKTSEWAERIGFVAIEKKGGLTEAEREHQRSQTFNDSRRFRAGVEGSISVLKRAFGMWRCLNRGFKHFRSTIACTVFGHNLAVLARALR